MDLRTPPEPVVCPFCGAVLRPVWMDFPGGIPSWWTPICRCREEAVRREERRHHLAESLDLAYSHFQLEGPEARFREVTLDSYHPHDPSQVRALEKVRAYRGRFAELKSQGKGLFLTGTPSTGKSHLAAALAHELVEHGYLALFLPVPRLLDHLRASYSREQESLFDLSALLLRADLLVLDDLGAVQVTEWSKDKLFQLVDGRYTRQIPLVVTSNFRPEGLERMLGERLVDRLVETCAVLPVLGSSYRRKEWEGRRR